MRKKKSDVSTSLQVSQQAHIFDSIWTPLKKNAHGKRISSSFNAMHRLTPLHPIWFNLSLSRKHSHQLSLFHSPLYTYSSPDQTGDYTTQL